MDVLTPEQRRLNMSRIRGKDTKPEMLLRRSLHARGFRFRLHRRDLPGGPDLVFPQYHAVIFVNGCFWHGHDCPCSSSLLQGRNSGLRRLQATGNAMFKPPKHCRVPAGRLLTVWECCLKGPTRRAVPEVIEDVPPSSEAKGIRLSWWEGRPTKIGRLISDPTATSWWTPRVKSERLPCDGPLIAI